MQTPTMNLIECLRVFMLKSLIFGDKNHLCAEKIRKGGIDKTCRRACLRWCPFGLKFEIQKFVKFWLSPSIEPIPCLYFQLTFNINLSQHPEYSDYIERLAGKDLVEHVSSRSSIESLVVQNVFHHLDPSSAGELIVRPDNGIKPKPIIRFVILVIGRGTPNAIVLIP